MIDALVATAGPGYFAAIAALFVAALISKAGAARAPNEEPARPSCIMTALGFAAGLTPIVLVICGYTVTEDAAERIVLMVLPIVAGFVGALLGALLGLITREARAMFRMASIVAGFGALILAVGVTLPHLNPAWLIGAVEALKH